LKAAHGVVEDGPGHLSVVFGVNQPRFRGARLLQEACIQRHVV
jgi:hypothetical protein